MIDYLNNGGALYIEGTNIGTNLNGTTFFDYLGAEYLSTPSSHAGITDILGIDGTFAQSLEFGYPNSTDADYQVDELGAGDGTLLFSSQDNDGRVVAYDGGIYRTIVSTPIFGAYQDGAAPSTKNNLMQLYLEFLNVPKCTFTGNITSSETGDPIPANVWSDGSNFETIAQEDGTYELLTEAGQHILKAEYFGYYQHTSSAMEIEAQEVIQYDITLDPLPTTNLQGIVTDINGNPVAAAVIMLLDVPVPPTITNQNGEYTFNIPGDYSYTMQVEITGYDIFTTEIIVPAEGYVQDVTLFAYLGFEEENGFTTESDWGPSFGNDWERGCPTESGGPLSTYDGVSAWGTNLDGYYCDNSGRSLISQEYYLEGLEDDTAYLKFYHWMEARQNSNTCWDGGNIQISVDGDQWEIIDPECGYTAATIVGLQGARGFGGETNGWEEVIFALNDYVGSNVQFRFQFGSTANNGQRGWFIDHFAIYGADVHSGGSGIVNHEIGAVPNKAELGNNYPNPFNPTTTISFGLAKEADATLTIYDVTGRLIRTLVSESKKAGYHSVIWNGTDDSGKSVGSGVYLYRIETDDYTQTKQCLLLK